MEPITTFTTYRFSTVRAKMWAFRQMGFAGSLFEQVDGLRFWKMLGSGKGAGFSMNPNWSRYALLCVWDSAAAANAFFDRAELSAGFDAYAHECWTVHLAVTRAAGTWDGANPFAGCERELPAYAGPVAVLTRGAISWNRLHRFWQHVPITSRAIENASGVLGSIGVGELPLVRQATLSFWESTQAMQEFAYRSSEHRHVVRKTREEGWYSEDLFARFVPLSSKGLWNGVDPLAGRLVKIEA